MTEIKEEKPADAPESCPGPSSETAGKQAGCEGCPSQKFCATGEKPPVDPDLALIADRLSTVKHKIIVLSGKGGVGKSTITTMLAYGLAMDSEAEVAVVDVDLCGPSIPRMFGVDSESIHQSARGWTPVYARENIAVVSIGFLLGSKDDAVIWRGPKKTGLIKQFLRDTEWDTGVDWMVVDTPPGTSDEHLSVVQYMQASGIDGAVLVTTPQQISLQDVRREITFCKRVGIRILGVVENMSGYRCPSCACQSNPFAAVGSAGGDEGATMKMCKEMDVHYLGAFPLDVRVGQACERGVSFLTECPDVAEDDDTRVKYLKLVAEVKQRILQ
eukprot:Partr_v1_DN24410_c0_g1_i1_m66371 putative Component of the cytosolic iron-sulfur (Fe S) protein assembly (CIA) machinery. Required for maturation of extramitochondrial Fe-S proteins. The NBP35-CFD1 heterotetramer forms a Fe-S scaffold complex, mediating the de novo assembly of an Fe-S cluster and its transfer to target apoproteins